MAFSFDHPVLHLVPPALEQIEFVTVRLPFISPFGISSRSVDTQGGAAAAGQLRGAHRME